jgi:hypothetical protein
MIRFRAVTRSVNHAGVADAVCTGGGIKGDVFSSVVCWLALGGLNRTSLFIPGIERLPTTKAADFPVRSVDDEGGMASVAAEDICPGNSTFDCDGDAGLTVSGEACRVVRDDSMRSSSQVWSVRPADGGANIDGADVGISFSAADIRGKISWLPFVTMSVNHAGAVGVVRIEVNRDVNLSDTS